MCLSVATVHKARAERHLGVKNSEIMYEQILDAMCSTVKIYFKIFEFSPSGERLSIGCIKNDGSYTCPAKIIGPKAEGLTVNFK